MRKLRQYLEISPEQRLSTKQRLCDFFYAETEAGMYDGTIDLVVPQYRLMHETLIEILRFHFGIYGEVSKESVTGSFLDIGYGTGTEALRVLAEFPNLNMAGIDLCAPMKDNFRNNARRRSIDFERRCRLMVGDICTAEGEPEVLLNLTRQHHHSRRPQRYRAVLSALTFHHFSEEEKFLAYRRAFEVLEPGGILLNGDLFTFAAKKLANWALKYDIRWIRESFSEPVSRGLAEDQAPTPEERNDLSERWVDHYLHSNRCGIVDQSPLEDDSALTCQREMLRQAGFREIAVPFRLWQLGILVGTKPLNYDTR